MRLIWATQLISDLDGGGFANIATMVDSLSLNPMESCHLPDMFVSRVMSIIGYLGSLISI
jgi:hypothetical protein